ncbi:MAG: 1-deoxy-D-xylulose-5-phosphate reductoisomerase, partial [Bifidobacteriaceae bacterium]|nr:1-deoxy-D-xylulose-5-phosphate reductoisomerase [Bifidobacteriaceae bacterium]
MAQRAVALLGSTGSIGTQALHVMAEHRDRFALTGLAASGAQPHLFASQIARWRPRTVGVATEDAALAVMKAVAALGL